MQGFEGASSISSNAYFGRGDDDIPQADEYGNYGDLEGAARDFVRKFGVTAGDDLENLSAVLGEGATKLQGWFLFFLRISFCYGLNLEKGKLGMLTSGVGRRHTTLSQYLKPTPNNHKEKLHTVRYALLEGICLIDEETTEQRRET